MVESSQGSKSFHTISSMLDDVSSRGKVSRDVLFSMYVEDRLNKSINTYYKQLIDSRNTLEHISNKRVIKHLIK